jgi:hypothetical protein
LTSRPPAQRLAEHLIRRACRHLPEDQRDDCYREWAAEASAILTDTGSRLHRTASALYYAADQSRGTRTILRAARKSQTAPSKPKTSPLRIAYFYFLVALVLVLPLAGRASNGAIGKLASNLLAAAIRHRRGDIMVDQARRMADDMLPALLGTLSTLPPARGTAAR